MEHSFTPKIKQILNEEFPGFGDTIFESSPLVTYLNLKTRSAERGSKARGSFGNLYALYVLVEDYIANGYVRSGSYSQYEGAVFSDLFNRQRQLPFGSKLQNHHLNHRLNGEFRKYFPTSEYLPITHDSENARYWINENLLTAKCGKKTCNLAKSIIRIIDEYVAARRLAFETFIRNCQDLQVVYQKKEGSAYDFIRSLLAPNVDARIFEIVSYSILKYSYRNQSVYFGFSLKKIRKENLKLYKTGRTNANDGGIDFVMRPLGRFFQVTETLDVRKYFLDIDKIERYPITFVIKSEEDTSALLAKLEAAARKHYFADSVVRRYVASIEEIINIPMLMKTLDDLAGKGSIRDVLDEIVLQSKLEFDYEDGNDDEDEDSSDA